MWVRGCIDNDLRRGILTPAQHISSQNSERICYTCSQILELELFSGRVSTSVKNSTISSGTILGRFYLEAEDGGAAVVSGSGPFDGNEGGQAGGRVAAVAGEVGGSGGSIGDFSEENDQNLRISHRIPNNIQRIHPIPTSTPRYHITSSTLQNTSRIDQQLTEFSTLAVIHPQQVVGVNRRIAFLCIGRQICPADSHVCFSAACEGKGRYWLGQIGGEVST